MSFVSSILCELTFPTSLLQSRLEALNQILELLAPRELPPQSPESPTSPCSDQDSQASRSTYLLSCVSVLPRGS